MKKIYRSISNRKIAGVCGGLGEYFKIDPVFIRLSLVFMTFLGVFITFIIAGYLLAWLLIPEKTSTKGVYYRPLFRSRNNRIFAGVLGGIAEFFHVDPMIVRIAFIATFFITFFLPLLCTYIAGVILIPENPMPR